MILQNSRMWKYDAGGDRRNSSRGVEGGDGGGKWKINASRMREEGNQDRELLTLSTVHFLERKKELKKRSNLKSEGL